MIPVNEIIFIEKSNKDTLIHTRNKNFSVNYTLKDLELKLPSNFIRCHRSFIINMNLIFEMRNLNENCYSIQFNNCKKDALFNKDNIRKISYLQCLKN
ncbi:LytTR family DNA-binding domain-containing protein [Bacillus manliponensis]|uniref:LytTR family DNA-binding domain-containing protein n=1 Tax=Bacillus manliponensis TaxID=574376 RepID=UPI003B84891A